MEPRENQKQEAEFFLFLACYHVAAALLSGEANAYLGGRWATDYDQLVILGFAVEIVLFVPLLAAVCVFRKKVLKGADDGTYTAFDTGSMAVLLFGVVGCLSGLIFGTAESTARFFSILAAGVCLYLYGSAAGNKKVRSRALWYLGIAIVLLAVLRGFMFYCDISEIILSGTIVGAVLTVQGAIYLLYPAAGYLAVRSAIKKGIV